MPAMVLARSRKQGYAVAAALTVGALMLRFLLDPFLGGLLPFYVFYFAVLVAAAYGGYGPGVFTLAAGFLFGLYFFVTPRYSLTLEDAHYRLTATRFLVVAASMVFVAGRLHAGLVRYRRRLADARSAEAVCRQAQRSAEEEHRLEAERGRRFLATIARELRLPMVPMVDPLVVLERTGGDAAVASALLREHRARSLRFVERLERLMDLGDTARMRAALDRRPIDLRRIVDQAAARSRAAHGALDVRLDVPLDPLHVQADALRLRRMMEDALDHLLATAPAGQRLRARLYRAHEEVVVVFLPEGAQEAGIPAMDGPIPDALVLARRIAERHGGSFHADGGSVMLRLPLLPAPDLVMAPALPSRKAVADERTGPARVLLCSDDAAFAEPLCTLLNGQGHAAYLVHDARDARTLVATDRPDVVLIDLYTRTAEGEHLARAIRAATGGEGPVLIAIAPAGKDRSGIGEGPRGFTGRLAKPRALP